MKTGKLAVACAAFFGVMASWGADVSGRDAVAAAYAFYLDEPDRVWKDDVEFVRTVYGADFVGEPPPESVVFSHVKTGDRNVDTEAALKLRSMLEPGDVIVSVLTNGFFARVYTGDALRLGRPRVLGTLPGKGTLWEGDCANLLFNYDWEEFALATGGKSGPAFRLVRPVRSGKCRLSPRRRLPEGIHEPIADERVRGLIETVYALYLKGPAAQYCYYKLCDEKLIPNDPKDYTWTRTHRWTPIEDCTPDKTFFSICSSFPVEMYYNATGLRLRRDEPGSTCLYLHLPEEFSVYRYDARTSKETVEEAIAKIRSLLEPGDVITAISIPWNGHTMMYLGEIDGHAKAIHGTGRNYDGHPKYALDRKTQYVPAGGKEVFELDGSICMDDIDALMFTPGHYEDLRHFKQLLLWRPFKSKTLSINAATKARLKYPRLRYDRRVQGGIFGAVVSGGDLGYSVWLKNFSDTAYTVPVEETVPEGTEIVSAGPGCDVAGGKLSWKVHLNPREERLLEWRVRVKLPPGSVVVAGGGNAGGIPSNTLRTEVLPQAPSFEKSLEWARKNLTGIKAVPDAMKIDGWFGGFRTVEGGPEKRTRETRIQDLLIGDVVFSVKDLSRPEKFRVWVKGPDGFVEQTERGLEKVSETDFSSLLSLDFFVGLRPSKTADGSASDVAEEAIGIANPGFETGREAWRFDRSNVFVVDDVARTGSRSACIRVDDAMKDCLYIKRYIPVEGGGCYSAECYVKTENVRRAKCSQGSVGAGLIVEWLDRDRKWIGTGQYACKLWGTEDWRRRRCDNLKAPAQAGYAVVYLALRGAGKAWFDDLVFRRKLVSVEKVSPVPDSVIACNTPLFRWKESRGARSYSVVVSPTADFSRGVKTWATDGLTSFRLTEPLPPGTWYWKVTAPGCDDVAPWKFVQSAPADRDCLPPEVMSPGARVHSSDEPFEVLVRDDTFRGVKVVFEGVCAAGKAVAGKNLRKYVFNAPAAGWKPGLTVGSVITGDAAGNKASRTFYLLNAGRPDNFVKVDGEGFYTVGGKRFFPLSIYEVKPVHFREVREAGFDNVHLYGWEGGQDDERCRSYLDKCWQTDGLRAFIGFDRGQATGNGLMHGNYGHVAARVGALADHPGLFCWYLYDEPELLDQFVSPARLKSYKELIHALDPYHPVALSTWNNAMVGVRDYRPTWDVHWMQAYGKPGNMLEIIESNRKMLACPSPLTLILGCNDGALSEVRRRGGTPDPDLFSRDYDRFRASAFLGVVQGSNGLSWWWFAKDRKDFYSAAQSPKGWRDLTKVIGELRKMRPLLSGPGKAVSGKVTVDGADVVWWTKKYGGKRWAIAVNASEKTVTAGLDIPGFGKVRREFGRYGVWIGSK